MSMQSLLAASQSMAKMQTMQSVKTQMQGTANVLRMESKLDGGNEKKDSQAADLEQKSNSVMGNLMDEVNNINEVLKPEEDAKADKEKEEEAAIKSPKKDSIELSDSATKYIGEKTYAKPAVSEPATYNASGGKNVGTAVKLAPTLEITA